MSAPGTYRWMDPCFPCKSQWFLPVSLSKASVVLASCYSTCGVHRMDIEQSSSVKREDVEKGPGSLLVRTWNCSRFGKLFTRKQQFLLDLPWWACKDRRAAAQLLAAEQNPWKWPSDEGEKRNVAHWSGSINNHSLMRKRHVLAGEPQHSAQGQKPDQNTGYCVVLCMWQMKLGK